MENFSDDEKFEVESILEQRKRKGVLQYLVRWKDTGAEESTSWESAESIAADCAQAIKNFLKTKTKKRSVSRSRKSSRSKSRSRSSSRSRLTAAKTVKSPRSRSRGRPKKQTQEKAAVEEKIETPAAEEKSEKTAIEEQSEKTAVTEKTDSSSQRELENSNLEGNGSSSVVSSVLSSTTTVVQSHQSIVTEKEESEILNQGRVLRSSTMAAREQLEVQRVHNEQRPVREDDNKPRSSLWKIADYGVIALFILSVMAALFLFVEKFVDLEDFKNQAFPNMGLLKSRLMAAVHNVVEIGQYGVDRLSAFWIYLMESISGGSPHKEPTTTKH